MTLSFETQKFLILMVSSLTMFFLLWLVILVSYLKKTMPSSGSQRFMPMFFLMSLIILGLVFSFAF